VTIGGAAATAVTVVSATSITATTPAGSAGTASVVVTTPGGSITGPARYTYVTVVTTAKLTTSANPTAAQTPVRFTATITSGSGIPTGTVTFRDGTTVVGTATLAGGVATFTTSALTVGTHLITAAYSGNGTLAASTSAALAQTISVAADSGKLRTLQVAATVIEAQSSGQAFSNAVDAAISEGFSGSQQIISPSGTGLRFNLTADPAGTATPETRSRFDDVFSSFAAPEGRDFPAMPGTPRSRIDDALSALAQSKQVAMAQPPRRPEPPDWLVWADVQVAGIAHWGTGAAPTLYGNQVNTLLGLTRKLSPDLLVGVLGGYETFDYRSDAVAGRLKGGGWTVGSYLGGNLWRGVRFDAAAAYSGVGYEGAAGTTFGQFNGNRWLMSAGLTGSYKAGGFEIQPSAKIYGLWERESAYTDLRGTLQPDRTFTTGRASGGVKLLYSYAWGSGIAVAPYAGLYADYYFSGDNAAAVALAGAAPTASTPFLEGWSARATGGVAATFENGAAISFGGEFGGIGGNTQIWTFRGRASLPF
jgi:hypothetical protein